MDQTPPRTVRQVVTPEQLTGVYTPVYLGNALYHFVNSDPGAFGPLDPITALQGGPVEALMDSLPLLRQGYSLRNSITMLMYIYTHTNQLQDPDDGTFIHPDSNMNEAFGGQIPATFFTYRDETGRLTKISVDEATRRGLLSYPLNTYEIIALSHPDFNHNRFKSFYFQNIAALNYYSPNNLADDPSLQPVFDAINSDEVRNQLLIEHEILKQVSKKWQQLLEPLRKQQREQRKLLNQQTRYLQQQETIQLPTTQTLIQSPPRLPTIGVPFPTTTIPIVTQLSPPRVPTVPIPVQLSPPRVPTVPIPVPTVRTQLSPRQLPTVQTTQFTFGRPQ